MNTYTTKELEDLRLYMNYNYAYLNLTRVFIKKDIMTYESLNNTKGLLNNYKDPDIIYSKILEFSKLSEAHRLIFNIIYSKTLEELIPYLNTEFEPIVVWRYSLEKKQI
jgi:hypothetical protein